MIILNNGDCTVICKNHKFTPSAFECISISTSPRKIFKKSGISIQVISLNKNRHFLSSIPLHKGSTTWIMPSFFLSPCGVHRKEPPTDNAQHWRGENFQLMDEDKWECERVEGQKTGSVAGIGGRDGCKEDPFGHACRTSKKINMGREVDE